LKCKKKLCFFKNFIYPPQKWLTLPRTSLEQSAENPEQDELDQFYQSCDLSKYQDSDEDIVDYESFKSIKKNCTCGKCQNIWSEKYEHVCCHQTHKWRDTVSGTEAEGCIVNSDSFQQPTNMYAVRNMLMQMHRKKRVKNSDPPANRHHCFIFV
jgi:hypothetical protein